MKQILLLPLFMLLILSGCTTDPDTQELRMNSKVLVTLKENISKEGRKFILDCKTDSIYECSNFGISFQQQRNGNVIDVNFTHIVTPQTCAASLGPATAIVDLGFLLTGTYTLQVLVNESVLQTSMEITPEYYKLNDTSRTWVEVLNPELRRIPENAIWGHVGFSSDSFAVRQVQPFFDSLEILGAQELELIPGDYTYFQIDSSGTMNQPDNPGTENAIPFVYIYNNDIPDIRELVKRYGKSSPLSVALFTSKGDVFYTWQLADEP
ncbi:MAG: hypothetical protein R6W90_04735 [Ignavibacteriaceae bacterium]